MTHNVITTLIFIIFPSAIIADIRSISYASCFPVTQGDYCQLVCSTGCYSTVGQILDRTNFTYGECRNKILTVRLESTVYFPNWTIPEFWLDTSLNIGHLDIDIEYVKEIHANAFNSLALQFTETLAIYNLKAFVLHSEMFNGLQSLRNLYLYKVHLIMFPTNFLQLIGQQLKQLMVYRATATALTDIATLTGTSNMSSLQWARVIGNLNNTLNEFTFKGMCETVVILELSSCGIQSIGPRTFDGMNFLELLSLDQNQLTTLDSNLFDGISRNSNISIILYNNPWACDCNLVDFRADIRDNPEVFAGSDIVCRTPSSLAGSKVKLSEFVCNPIFDQIFSPVYESLNVCRYPIIVVINFPVIMKRKVVIIQNLRNGRYVIQTNSTVNTQTWFIWNSRNSFPAKLPWSADLIFCRPTNCSKIEVNQAYTACWMDLWRSSISPYDCVSLLSKPISAKSWLPASYKKEISTGAGIAMVAVMFMGSLGGVVWIKWIDCTTKSNMEEMIEGEEEVVYYTIDETIEYTIN